MANDTIGTPVQGYSRAEVDDFLEAAALERARLEAEITDARSRIGRARSAIGMHRVMVAMLLETQRELTELRAAADAEAEAILAQAERDAAVILSAASATDRITPVAPGAAVAPQIEADTLHPEIDLGRGGFGLTGAETALTTAVDAPRVDGAVAGTDEYFDFLRGALADESPLGPEPE